MYLTGMFSWISLILSFCSGIMNFTTGEPETVIPYVPLADPFILCYEGAYYSAEEHICVATSPSPLGPFKQAIKQPMRTEPTTIKVRITEWAMLRQMH